MTLRCFVLLLACAASLVAGIASSQPRIDMEVSREAVLPVTEPAAIAAWLKRLVGKFKYEGMVEVGSCTRTLELDGSLVPSDNCQPITGNSECVNIGDGPGVQCILSVTWLDIFNQKLEETLVSYLDPAMQLYGLDPRTSEINHLVVNNKGLAEGGTGAIKGDSATFRNLWVPRSVCPEGLVYRVTRIQAQRDSQVMYVRFGSVCGMSGAIEDYAVMTLRRIREDVPAETSGAG